MAELLTSVVLGQDLVVKALSSHELCRFVAKVRSDIIRTIDFDLNSLVALRLVCFIIVAALVVTFMLLGLIEAF